MASNAVATAGDQQENYDPTNKTLVILEHKIRNLEKRKLKLEGYLQQRNGTLLSDDQLLAASKFNEVITTLNFARNFKNQLSNLLSTTKTKKHNTDAEKLIKIDDKIKEVLIFQNILENIKDENVQKDLLTGNNGAVQLTDTELSKLSHFSKLVSPKRRVAHGKPLFQDHLKTVSKHYMKLIDSNPNIVVGTSYADLKDCLLKIEKSGYLDHITINKEVKNSNKMNYLDTETPQVVHQPISDNISHNTNSNSEFTEDKIETIYFTNNIIDENVIEKNQHQNRNTTDSVFHSSYDFLQDSQLEEDVCVNLNSIPTQTFSHSAYSNNGPTDDAILKVLSTNLQHNTMGSGSYKEAKLSNSGNIVNISNSNSWTGKPELDWQNRTELGNINNLPKENWSMAQMINNCANSNWLHKTNSSSNGLVHNGYTENLNELLQKSLVFNKQESTINSNNTCFQSNFGQQLPQQNIGHYTNTNCSYDQSQSSDFNKKSASSFNPKVTYTGYTGGPSLGYQQGNSYVYNNPSYKNINDDFSRISRQT